MRLCRPVERACGKENTPTGEAKGTAPARSSGPQQPAKAATAAELESARAAQTEDEQLRRGGSAQPSNLESASACDACSRK